MSEQVLINPVKEQRQATEEHFVYFKILALNYRLFVLLTSWHGHRRAGATHVTFEVYTCTHSSVLCGGVAPKVIVSREKTMKKIRRDYNITRPDRLIAWFMLAEHMTVLPGVIQSWNMIAIQPQNCDVGRQVGNSGRLSFRSLGFKLPWHRELFCFHLMSSFSFITTARPGCRNWNFPLSPLCVSADMVGEALSSSFVGLLIFLTTLTLSDDVAALCVVLLLLQCCEDHQHLSADVTPVSGSEVFF